MATLAEAKYLDVLLVEDNLGDAELIKEMLDTMGGDYTFRVTHIGVARKAFRHLVGQTFHLIFLDLSLPDTYGLETVYSLLEAAGETPIIVVSGLEDEWVALHSMCCGVREFLVKQRLEQGQFERAVVSAIRGIDRVDSLRELFAEQ